MARSPSTKTVSSKKVGSNPKGSSMVATATAEKTEKKEKRERKPRPQFDLSNALGENKKKISLDDKGRLSGAPVNWKPQFSPLKRSHFDSRAMFLDWKALVVGQQIVKLQGRQQEFEEEAELERKGGDPTVKKMKRAVRLRKQLAMLEAQLKEEGIDI